jgi:hypothetical protein
LNEDGNVRGVSHHKPAVFKSLRRPENVQDALTVPAANRGSTRAIWLFSPYSTSAMIAPQPSPGALSPAASRQRPRQHRELAGDVCSGAGGKAAPSRQSGGSAVARGILAVANAAPGITDAYLSLISIGAYLALSPCWFRKPL